MKKALLLAVIFTSVRCGAQTYYPFLDNVAWYYGSYDWGTTTYYWYHTLGDTVIQGKTYTIVDRDMWSGNPRYFREDTVQQKVYYYGDTTEYVKYDFSLSVGDTFVSWGMQKFYIASIGTINTPMGSRKSFTAYSVPPMAYTYTYAVGIGSVGHPIEMMSVTDPVTGCVCSWNKYNQQTWGALDTSCHANPYFMATSIYEATNSFYRNIFPNPVTGQLPMNNLPEKFTLKLFDLSGKIVFEGTNYNPHFDTRTIPNSVYIYQIADADNHIGRGKIIVQN